MTDPVVCSDCGAVCVPQGGAPGYSLTAVPRIPAGKPRVHYLLRGVNLGQPTSTTPTLAEQDAAQMFSAFYDIEGYEERRTAGHAEGTERRICYACSAQLECETMQATNWAILYLTRKKDAPPDAPWTSAGYARRRDLPHLEPGSYWSLGDWPGSFSLSILGCVRLSQGRGFGGPYPVRTFRFVGPDGYVWSGRCAGNMDLARVKRTRERWLQGPNGWHSVKEK